MIKAIAIDDEPLALDILKRFCERSIGVNLIATFGSARAASDYLAEHEADLIFLDVQMPGMDGITFYNQLKNKPPLIFTTAHPDFAVHGFDMGAVDYLLKPFSFNRFEKAVQRSAMGLTVTDNQKEELILRVNYGLQRVALADISLIESFGDYAHVHLDGKDPLEVRITLKNIEKQLPVNRFARVHRSFIVPLNRIESVRNQTIYLSDREIPIGRSYSNPFDIE